MIKKILLGTGLLILGIIIGACGKQVTGADGYYFENESFRRTNFEVDVVLASSADDLKKLKAEHKVEVVPGYEVAAFSTLSMTSMHCTIYMIDPKVSYQPEWYGHELTHRIYGKWHTIQP